RAPRGGLPEEGLDLVERQNDDLWAATRWLDQDTSQARAVRRHVEVSGPLTRRRGLVRRPSPRGARVTTCTENLDPPLPAAANAVHGTHLPIRHPHMIMRSWSTGAFHGLQAMRS